MSLFDVIRSWRPVRSKSAGSIPPTRVIVAMPPVKPPAPDPWALFFAQFPVGSRIDYLGSEMRVVRQVHGTHGFVIAGVRHVHGTTPELVCEYADIHGRIHQHRFRSVANLLTLFPPEAQRDRADPFPACTDGPGNTIP